MKKRLFSLVLVLVLILGISAVPASAQTADGTQYKTVFVHGILGYGYNDGLSEIMNYWGMTSGNMMEYLRSQGYDVIDASVGPMSSCHDRCCELFAQLTGTVTDYGAAHSAAVEKAYANAANELKHDRFGRDYSGSAIVEDWGPVYENGRVTGWYDNKINLVAHSMGGPTAALFIQLLAEGDADEISWGREQAELYGGDWHDYVSPLFWGDYDGEYLINSLTTLAGALNGTDITECCENTIDLLMTMVAGLANATGLTDIASLYDFQLEHFGITKTPGKAPTDEEFFSSQKIRSFLSGYDCAPYDVSPDGTNVMKLGWHTYDNIYYFAYAGNRTHISPITGYNVPDADMMAILMPFGLKMGMADDPAQPVFDIFGNVYSSIDSTWRANDGVVNTVSARYPIGAAQKPYDSSDIEAGIWQWKDMRYDHMTFVGGLLDPKLVSQPQETRRFYGEIMSNIEACAPIERPAAFPFNDIAGSWYRGYITEAAELGIVNGYPDGSFRPDGHVSRAQFVTMLWRLAGSPKADAEPFFTDKGSILPCYLDAVKWGVSEGVILGYNDGSFRPDIAISRAQAAAMLYRYMKNVAGFDFGEFGDAGYTDQGLILSCYTEAVNAVTAAGIMNGTGGGRFDPDGVMSRGMAAAVTVRLYGLVK